MAYDISADFVDSTTAYDPRPSLDPLSDTGTLMTNVVTTGKALKKICFSYNSRFPHLVSFLLILFGCKCKIKTNS